MGENYMDRSFYPHHGPSKYSYTSAFGKGNNREKTASQAKVNTAYSGLATKAGNKFKILFNLKLLLDGARKAEMAFLAESGIDLSQGNNAQMIFKNFNLILNSQQLFERNLRMFEQLSNKVDNRLVDPSKWFHTYLSQAIDKYGISKKFDVKKATDAQLEKFINDVLGDATEKTYSKFIEVLDKNGNIKSLSGGESIGNQEQYNAMSEMIEVIRRLRSLGIFGKYGSLFNMDKLLDESIAKRGEDKGKMVKKPKITSQRFGDGGSALELITSVIGAGFAQIHQSVNNGFIGLTITGASTGSGDFNEQKGDTMIAYAQGKVDFSQMEAIFKQYNTGKGSKRIQNIKALSEYLNKFSESIKHLLVISDKNSFITAKYEGAHAQESMKLSQARSMLTLFGVSGIDELIDYLANAGPGMIQEDVNAQVRTALMSHIAYFLFDHVEISGTIRTGPNIVNIMNLSGTYIPLSVFLEGVYKSLDARLSSLSGSDNGDAARLVKVTLSLKGEAPIGEEWTAELWQSFRETRETNSTIEYKIMMDIADYITGLMR